MDQSQKQALGALQPFIYLANSSTTHSARFIANIITNATSAPNTFIFAELLETQAVQSLARPDTPEEYRSYLKLLEIFAWGSWEEYHATPNLPALSEAQALKLRLLSLLTLSTTHNPLTYPIVMKSLSLKDHVELESLVTKAIYSSLITARLSPTTTPPSINVISVAPLRDVRPQAVGGMISILTEWHERCQKAVEGIEAEINTIKADAAKRRAMEKDRAYRFEKSEGGWHGDDDKEGEGGSGSKESRSRKSFSKEGSLGGTAANAARRLFGGGSSSKGNKREFHATGGYSGNGQDSMEVDPSTLPRSMKVKLEAQNVC
ncbi:ACOB protein [Trichophyton equinum CBS 127.97]|uniref:ACOB protein n=1 Tax=Trichophyton equinum (strain ATCC MYA-4606 / CBS 127.97) TaxID=559882 RepID=F2PMD6_TRIEC|nr:ACOB protein [Trichophyton equinum CBS 127.97]